MSGGGGGIIIIRKAMQQALTDPLVSGQLPQHHRDALVTFINTDVSSWTADQHKHAFKAFEWANNHC